MWLEDENGNEYEADDFLIEEQCLRSRLPDACSYCGNGVVLVNYGGTYYSGCYNCGHKEQL
ncbi:TPA: hypothetical protein QDB06_000785 [Burkholderia vietnamiensis]|nr:hypothetical protein [Burkholderia vietnamiensis]